MKKTSKTPFAVLAGASLILSCVNIGFCTLHELSPHIPSGSDVAPWTPSGAPDFVERNDIRTRMPDVAEIYREYGFQRAAFQSYQDPTGRTLHLELHEMAEPAGAYGLLTFKRRGDCEPIDLGDEACLSERHLHVWKDRFLVTVTAPEFAPVTRDDFLLLARATCDTIAGTGARPDIVMLLPPEELDETSIHYLMGSLALPSAYNFGFLDTFRIVEGVGGRIGEDTAFLFRYSSEAEAERMLPNVIARLSGPDLYRLLTLADKNYEPTDYARPKFVLATESSYILMTAGDDIRALSNLIDRLSRRIRQMSSVQEPEPAR